MKKRTKCFWYGAGSWSAPRWVIVKAEVNAQGSQRRFIVTNRLGARVLPGATYDEYVMRGESENRNKEFKCDLAMDRLSDHRFKANFFRLYLHAIAMNLVIQARNWIKLPLSVRDRLIDLTAPAVRRHKPRADAGSRRASPRGGRARSPRGPRQNG